MKIRTRRIFTLGKNHIMSDNLKTVTAFKMQPQKFAHHSVPTSMFEQDLTNQLIALEVERKQSMGRTYASMLPAR
jgi:hypothetical protein